MKFIQLKDNNGARLYPYVKWETVEGKPTFLINPTAQSLTTLILTSIDGYNPSKTQTLQNINGTFQWVDNE